jgi:hypothetical protein
LTSLPSTPLKSSEQGGPQSSASRQLVHPVAAVILIAVDSLWTIPDMAAFAWVVTIPLCFLAVAIPTFLVQRFVKKDSTLKAAAVASGLGVIAAIPTPITGTAVGGIVLALAGIRSMGRNP